MAQFASDTFTGTDGTELSAYSANWTKRSGITFVITDANRVRPISSTATYYYHTGTPASADYTVSADLRVVTTAVNSFFGLCGRGSTSADTFYHLRRHESAGDWQLYSVVAGSFTLLGSYTQSLSDSTTYVLALEMVGTAIKAYIDGVERISVTNSAITDAGKAGLRATNSSTTSNAAGQHIDNFSADDVGGGAPTEALTNNFATTSPGTPVPSLSLATSGNSATASVGTLTPSVAITAAIAGNAATTSSGTVTPAISLALSGNGATTSAGAVGVGGTTQALTGNAATASAGTPVAAISLALSGNAATSSAGTVAPALSAAITGNAVTTAAGTPVAALSLALSGNAATAAAGDVGIPGIIVPTSNEAIASAGTVSPGITVALTGNGATTSVGSVSPAIALALSGLAGTSAAGIVIPGLTVSLTGNGATAAAGSAVPATGDINVALTGNAAIAYAGSMAIGGFESAWWRYEIPAQDVRYSVAPQSLTFTIER